MKIDSLALLLFLQIFFACNELPETNVSAAVKGITSQKPSPEQPGLIFKSVDGGRSWQNISEGLATDKLSGGLFANEGGMFLRAGNAVYHNPAGSNAPVWEKGSLPDDHSIIAPGRARMFAYDYHLGEFRQKLNGLALWSPVFGNFEQKGILNVFETAGGTVFIVCDRGRGLYRSADNGKNWKEVHRGVWQLAESNGVLLANSINGIIRSVDDGETWEAVNTGDRMGVHLSPINGGFAAITYHTKPDNRRLRVSYDGGQNWEAIEGNLPKGMKITSIIQAGAYFFCGHPDGIYRSEDQGKTWQLVLAGIEGKSYSLFVSGDVVYAVPGVGC